MQFKKASLLICLLSKETIFVHFFGQVPFSWMSQSSVLSGLTSGIRQKMKEKQPMFKE